MNGGGEGGPKEGKMCLMEREKKELEREEEEQKSDGGYS